MSCFCSAWQNCGQQFCQVRHKTNFLPPGRPPLTPAQAAMICQALGKQQPYLMNTGAWAMTLRSIGKYPVLTLLDMYTGARKAPPDPSRGSHDAAKHHQIKPY